MWLFSSRKTGRTPPARRRSPAYRPRLEPLEDRCLLNAGALDPTFGNGAGYVTTAVSSGAGSATRVLLQPSGNIVAAGEITVTSTTTTHHKTTTTTTDFFGAVTYNPDGSLDTAFGSGGIVQQQFVGQGAYGSGFRDAVLEPTGPTGDAKMLLAGIDAAQGGMALMRLNPNGSLDTTFGGNGQVITAFQTSGYLSNETAEAVRVTSSGQIVALGADGSHTWMLARYNPDGSLDSTFGSGGKATTVFSSSIAGFDALLRAVAQQPDGKLVAVGDEYWSGVWHAVVVRYNANGSLDTSFGSGGIVMGGSLNEQNRGVAVYPNAATANDGKIVVSGVVFNGPAGGPYTLEAAVERYNPDGSADTTFGNGTGYVLIGNPTTTKDGADAVAIETDSKPIFVGFHSDGGSTSPYLLQVGRLNLDGSLDSSFGNGGLVKTAMLGNSSGWAVALQPDGKIVAAGYSYANGGNNAFALARYLTSQPEIGSFTASPNPVAAGSNVTLTVSGITDGNANSTITQVAFYYFDSAGNKVTLGYGAQTSPGVWTLTFTVNLAPGTYALFAQAEDNYGVFGDPLALTLTVQ